MSIFCVVAGYPVPTITWQHNGTDVISDNRVSIFLFDNESNEESVSNVLEDEVSISSPMEVLSVLRISSVKTDTGHYTCTATNHLPQTRVVSRIFNAGNLVVLGMCDMYVRSCTLERYLAIKASQTTHILAMFMILHDCHIPASVHTPFSIPSPLWKSESG